MSMERGQAPGPDYFPADVHLLDTTTGERRVYLTWEPTPDESGLGGIHFRYEDGNDACDCNRADWFARAVGEQEDASAPCGDSRYVVEKIVNGEGVTLYSEAEAVSA